MSGKPIHRDGDKRKCLATTIVFGQNNVYANKKLVSVDSDPNSHGGGSLIARNNQVYINNKLVVNHSPELAEPDLLCPLLKGFHCAPLTDEGSKDVFVGD